MAEYKIDAKTSKLESGLTVDYFHRAIAVTLPRAGHEVISLSENIELIIERGIESYERGIAEFSDKGNFVREGVVYIEREPRIVKISPLFRYCFEAAEASGYDFTLDIKKLEEFMVDSIKCPMQIEIPINRLGEDELTAFIFGGARKAKKYGEFSQERLIKSVTIDFTGYREGSFRCNESPIILPIYFEEFIYKNDKAKGFSCIRSQRLGNGYGVFTGSRVRGVRQLVGA